MVDSITCNNFTTVHGIVSSVNTYHKTVQSFGMICFSVHYKFGLLPLIKISHFHYSATGINLMPYLAKIPVYHPTLLISDNFGKFQNKFEHFLIFSFVFML